MRKEWLQKSFFFSLAETAGYLLVSLLARFRVVSSVLSSLVLVRLSTAFQVFFFIEFDIL